MTYRIMTVCTGNICRSPMAEVVVRAALQQAGLGDEVEVFSTGTSSEEHGHPIDRRAQRVLTENGYEPGPHRARRVTTSDIADADLILAATNWHARTLRRLADGDDDLTRRIVMLRAFDPELVAEVGHKAPESAFDLDDPWYGGYEDFVQTLELIEAATPGIIEHVKRELDAN